MSLFTSGYTGVEIDEGIRRTYEVFSNRNLLDNWDYQVNQQGQSSYSSYGSHNVDRWRYGGSVERRVDVAPRQLTLTATATGMYLVNLQRVPWDGGLSEHCRAGKPLTISYYAKASRPMAAYQGGQIGTDWTFVQSTFGLSEAQIASAESSGYYQVYIGAASLPGNEPIPAGDWVMLAPAKFEAGAVSTLDNDLSAKHGAQLRECQRYYRVWKTEAARTAALNEVGLMRLAAPTLGTINIGGTTYYTASAEL